MQIFKMIANQESSYYKRINYGAELLCIFHSDTFKSTTNSSTFILLAKSLSITIRGNFECVTTKDA